MVKVIWHKAASLPQTNDSTVFARWHQCAPTYASFLWPTQVHNQTASQSLQPVLHSLWQSVVGHALSCPFHLKVALLHRVIWIPSNIWFLEPTSVISGVFTASLYFTMGSPFPPKLPLPTGDLDLHLYGSLRPANPRTQTASWSVQPFLQGSQLWQTETDSPRYSVCNNRCIYVCSMVMRPKKVSPDSQNWSQFHK